jgi:hypothetical protein
MEKEILKNYRLVLVVAIMLGMEKGGKIIYLEVKVVKVVAAIKTEKMVLM